MTRNSKAGRGFSGKAVLELMAAAFILFGPTVLGAAMKGWGLYAVFALTAAVFALRLIETGRIHISINIALGGALLACALFALVWAEDKYAHVRLIFTILTLILFAMLAGDYFSRENPGRLGERLTLMVMSSAFVCGIWNLAVWGIARRFSLKEPFSAGLGDSDLLGLFMLIGLWCFLRAFGGKKKLKAGTLVLILPMVFSLLMSRSLLTGLTGGLFILWFSVRKKRPLPAVIGGGAAILSGAALAASGVRELRPFADGLLCGLTNIGGLGGGGFLLRQGELQSVYYSVDKLRLGAELGSSLGLAGLLIFLAVTSWMAYLAVSRKSYFCALGSALCVFAFFVEAGESLAGLQLITGALIYGEWRQGRTVSIRFGAAARAGMTAALAALAVYGGILGVADGIKASGVKSGSGENLALAAKLNPLDGDSSFLAAKAYLDAYELSSEKSDAAYAGYYMDQAIRRNGETGEYMTEYAEIKAASGELDEAAKLDSRAIELAPLRDDYKVRAAAHLYSLIETAQKGSLAAQNYHKRILELAGAVEDMDDKKLINDYADRAQPFTRTDFGLEDDNGTDSEDSVEGEE